MKKVINKNRYEHLKEMLQNNNVILLSGNSTAGKTFLVDKLIDELSNVDKLKSLTTRKQRNPQDTDYIFVTKEEFDKQHNIYDLEYPKNSGIHYSYTEEEIQKKLKSGKKIIIIVAANIIDKLKLYLNKNQINYKSIFWYITPETLKKRYLERLGIETITNLPNKIEESPNGSKEDLAKRLEILKQEHEQMLNYDFIVPADEKINFNKLMKK